MRLIDADKLKTHYAWWKNGTEEHNLDEMKELFDTIVNLQPTVEAVPTDFHDKCQQIEIQKRLKLEEELKDAEPIRHGHWINVGSYDNLWRCSVCKELQCCYGRYCSTCGAKMDEVTE